MSSTCSRSARSRKRKRPKALSIGRIYCDVYAFKRSDWNEKYKASTTIELSISPSLTRTKCLLHVYEDYLRIDQHGYEEFGHHLDDLKRIAFCVGVQRVLITSNDGKRYIVMTSSFGATEEKKRKFSQKAKKLVERFNSRARALQRSEVHQRKRRKKNEAVSEAKTWVPTAGASSFGCDQKKRHYSVENEDSSSSSESPSSSESSSSSEYSSSSESSSYSSQRTVDDSVGDTMTETMSDASIVASLAPRRSAQGSKARTAPRKRERRKSRHSKTGSRLSLGTVMRDTQSRGAKERASRESVAESMPLPLRRNEKVESMSSVSKVRTTVHASEKPWFDDTVDMAPLPALPSISESNTVSVEASMPHTDIDLMASVSVDMGSFSIDIGDVNSHSVESDDEKRADAGVIHLTKHRTVTDAAAFEGVLKSMMDKYVLKEAGDSKWMKQSMKLPKQVTVSAFLPADVVADMTLAQHSIGDRKPALSELVYFADSRMCATLVPKKHVSKLLPTVRHRVVYELIQRVVIGFEFDAMLVNQILQPLFHLRRGRSKEFTDKTIGHDAFESMYDWQIAFCRVPKTDSNGRTTLLTIPDFRQAEVNAFIESLRADDQINHLWELFCDRDCVLHLTQRFPLEYLQSFLASFKDDCLVALFALKATAAVATYAWNFCTRPGTVLDAKSKLVHRFFDAVAKASSVRLSKTPTLSKVRSCLNYFFLECGGTEDSYQTVYARFKKLIELPIEADLLEDSGKLKKTALGTLECKFGHCHFEQNIDSMTLRTTARSVAVKRQGLKPYCGSGLPLDTGCPFAVDQTETQMSCTPDVQIVSHTSSGNFALRSNCVATDDTTNCDSLFVMKGAETKHAYEAINEVLRSRAGNVVIPDDANMQAADRLLAESHSDGYGLKKSVCLRKCPTDLKRYMKHFGIEPELGTSKREDSLVNALSLAQTKFGLLPFDFVVGEWKVEVIPQPHVSIWRPDALLKMTNLITGLVLWAYADYFGFFHDETVPRDCGRLFGLMKTMIALKRVCIYFVLDHSLLKEDGTSADLNTMCQLSIVERMAHVFYRELARFFVLYPNMETPVQLTSIGCDKHRCHQFQTRLSELNKEMTTKVAFRALAQPLHEVLLVNRVFGICSSLPPIDTPPVSSVRMQSTLLRCPLPGCHVQGEQAKMRKHYLEDHCGVDLKAPKNMCTPYGSDLLMHRARDNDDHFDFDYDKLIWECPRELQ